MIWRMLTTGRPITMSIRSTSACSSDAAAEQALRRIAPVQGEGKWACAMWDGSRDPRTGTFVRKWKPIVTGLSSFLQLVSN